LGGGEGGDGGAQIVDPTLDRPHRTVGGVGGPLVPPLGLADLTQQRLP